MVKKVIIASIIASGFMVHGAQEKEQQDQKRGAALDQKAAAPRPIWQLLKDLAAAVELGSEQADKVIHYIFRDLHDAEYAQIHESMKLAHQHQAQANELARQINTAQALGLAKKMEEKIKRAQQNLVRLKEQEYFARLKQTRESVDEITKVLDVVSSQANSNTRTELIKEAVGLLDLAKRYAGKTERLAALLDIPQDTIKALIDKIKKTEQKIEAAIQENLVTTIEDIGL